MQKLLALGLVLMGCAGSAKPNETIGDVASDADVHAAATDAEVHAAPADATMGSLGNGVAVLVQDVPLGPPNVHIIYDDKSHFFGAATTINVLIKTAAHAKATGAPLVDTMTIALTAGGESYSGDYTLAFIDRVSQEIVLDSIAVAFSDTQGENWDNNNSQSYVFTVGRDYPVVNFGSNEVATGVANHVSLYVYGLPPSGGLSTPNVTFWYVDDVGYFGGAPTLSAYVSGGAALSGQFITLQSVGQNTYSGAAALAWPNDPTQLMPSFQLAVADVAHTKWDSNNSQNYRFALGSNSAVCNVVDYGAKGDGATLNTVAIQGAIDDCARRAGTVSIPAGVFVSGMIALKSGVTLSLATGATLKGSMNDADYPTVVPDAANSQVAVNCQKALVYANGADDVTITGGGTIDGNGGNSNWINLSTTSADYLERNRPIAIYFALSTNVTIENVNVVNVPMWAVVNLENDGVHINNVSVTSDNASGRTRDGIDTIDSQNVLIENCTIATQDDALCLKSGLPVGAAHSGLTNVVVRNSTITKSVVANGLKFGTATSGAFDNIEFDNITVSGVKQAAMAVESVDGGAISNVRFNNITVQDTGAVAYVILGARGANIGSINGVSFTNVNATNLTQTWGSAISGSIVNGTTYAPQNVSFTNVNVQATGGLTVAPATPPEYAYDTGEYPDPQTWGDLPAFGYYVRHASNVQFSGCTTTVSPADARAAIVVTADVTGSGY